VTGTLITLIWAQSADGVIGADGTLPWHVPEDMERFRDLTMGDTVVMGRRTWESLPSKFRPLPGRRNVVVTRDPSYSAPGAEVVTSLARALRTSDDVWVGGGAQIYADALAHADRLLITDVDTHVDGDTAVQVFGPAVGPEWREVEVGEWQTSRTGMRYRFRELRRG